MKREYPDRPIAGVGGVIIDKGRVLLIKRGNPPYGGEWSIPGGAIELGETAREALEREVREETGLIVRPTRLLGVYDRIIQDKDGAGVIIHHYVLIDFLCAVVTGEIQAGSDAVEARWVKAEDLKRFCERADTVEVIQLGFAAEGL